MLYFIVFYKDLLTVILKKQFRTIFSQTWYCSLGPLEMDAEMQMEVEFAYLESRKGGCRATLGIAGIKVQSRLGIVLASPVRKLWSKYCQSWHASDWDSQALVLHVSPTPSYSLVHAALEGHDLRWHGSCRHSQAGADGWQLSANHSPGSWASSLSLKGDRTAQHYFCVRKMGFGERRMNNNTF